jgi:hypothetical protein
LNDGQINWKNAAFKSDIHDIFEPGSQKASLDEIPALDSQDADLEFFDRDC